MNESILEGSMVLEKLAEHDLVDEFYEAVDADNFGKASALMKKAGVDLETINAVLKEMSEV